MQHLNEDTLRRRYDEPIALSAEEQRHYASCLACQERFVAVAADARTAADLLAVPPVRVDTATAYRQLQRRIDIDAANTAPASARAAALAAPWYRRWAERMIPMSMYQFDNRRLVKPVGGVAAAAALIGALTLTPAGSFAQSLLSVFQPQQIAAVPVTQADMASLRALPNLSQYGTLTQGAQPASQFVADAAAARSATDLPVYTPSSLPAGIPSTVIYAVMSQGTASFTFSAAKARAEATREGRALPAMPASLDGSTLQATIGPAVVAVYSSNPGALQQQQVSHEGAGGRIRVGLRGIAMGRSMPSLVIVQAKAPTVASTGATVTEIRDYLLDQPGISSQLAAEIKAIGDPTTTLPVPIPVDRANAQPVQVQSVSGLLVGDNTGTGSAMIWMKHGMVYGVAGMLSEDQIISVANSLQ